MMYFVLASISIFFVFQRCEIPSIKIMAYLQVRAHNSAPRNVVWTIDILTIQTYLLL